MCQYRNEQLIRDGDEDALEGYDWVKEDLDVQSVKGDKDKDDEIMQESPAPLKYPRFIR